MIEGRERRNSAAVVYAELAVRSELRSTESYRAWDKV